MKRSLLLVKPESVAHEDAVVRWLGDQGFVSDKAHRRQGWRAMLPVMYPEFPPQIIAEYRDLYDSHSMADEYLVIRVHHPEDALGRLASLKGHFRAYQDRPEESLRGLWGLPSAFNRVRGDITLVLNGFHAPASDEELALNEQLFNDVSGNAAP